MQPFDARTSDTALLSGEGGATPNPLLLAHRLLRGRYVWAGVLGAVLAVPLAWLGHRSKTPMYTSEGVVAVMPTQRQILYRNEFNEAIPFFDQYVERQAALLGSERVVGVAIRDPKVRENGWPDGTAGIAALSDATDVEMPRRSGMIILRVSHESPGAAKAACNAILQAYESMHKAEAEDEFRATEQVLVNRERSLREQREEARRQIRLVAEEYGTEDLQPMIDGLNREVLALDVMIAQLESELAGRGESTATAQTPAVAVEDLSLEDLAQRDAELGTLLRRREQLVAEIDAYTAQFSPQHMEVRTRQGQLQTTERLLQIRADVVRASWNTGVSTEFASAAELRIRLGQSREQRDRLFSRLREMAADQSTILLHESTATQAEADRLETDQRLDALRIERENTQIGRAQIQQAATTPTRPSSDKRLMLAAAGGAAGLAAGFGILGLIGLMHGGFRYIDEFDGERDSLLLGVVPDLGGRREPTAEAALCIHHARALLERRVPMHKDRGRIIGVTSPTAGDGKTTVCCSLATSFAMAGFKTVIVDADFVGRGMTSRLDMDRAAGLGDVLAGVPLDEALARGGTPNLTLLSAGREEAMPADRIAASAVAPLLERLARQNDIVLVDSGPVLGSIEATVVVGLADGVLCVVSRGQSQKMFAAMRRKLRSLGAELVGVVFNRAYPKDFAHSTHTSVVSAQSQRSRSVQVPDFVLMGNRGMASRLPGAAESTEAKARSA